MKINEIKQKIKQYGLINSIKRFMYKIIRKFGISREIFLVCKIDLIDFSGTVSLQKDFYVKKLSYQDFNKKSLFKFDDIKLKKYKNLLDKEGYYAFGVYNKKNIMVYYCWISLKEGILPGLTNKTLIKKDEGLLINAFCHPDYRKYGIHTYMNQYRLNQIKNSGKKTGVGYVLKENIPARKSQKKVGMICNEIIILKTVFGKQKFQKKIKHINL